MREQILTVLKFIFFIAIIPILMAAFTSFQNVLSGLMPVLKKSFYSGASIYVVIYLFLFNLQSVYLSAKSITEEIFKLLPPFDKLIPYVFPFYVLLTGAAYYIIHVLLKMEPSAKFYFFVMGFLMSLHLISVAKEFQEMDKLPARPHYFFALSLSFIGTIFIFVLLLDLITTSVSFSNFWGQLCRQTDDSYEKIFRGILTLVKRIPVF